MNQYMQCAILDFGAVYGLSFFGIQQDLIFLQCRTYQSFALDYHSESLVGHVRGCGRFCHTMGNQHSLGTKIPGSNQRK